MSVALWGRVRILSVCVCAFSVGSFGVTPFGHYSFPILIFAGTASLLPRVDGGVVDPDLKVYGTINVRVVDASIMPMQFAAHPQASVYGIAEFGSKLIKKQVHHGGY